jgi:DNA-binding NarL/FixJ family response regulator
VIEKLANLRQPHGSNKPRAGLQDLTARERDILALVCQGSGDREIAEKLGLFRNTIRNRIAAIYGKTDVHHRGALVVWARERGFTGDHPPGMGRPSVRTNIR